MLRSGATDLRSTGRVGPSPARPSVQLSSVGVADPPLLAPGVELAGELTGSAFTTPQYLIEREGHYVQVPAVLYRIAENADGQRTLDQIAREVTESTEWIVTPARVAQLIATKLIPLGIIAPAAGAVGLTAADGKAATAPLMLRMKVRVLGPRVIDPITNVLRFLYAPPAVAIFLVAALAGHIWLYSGHGLLASIRDVVYTPGAAPAVLALLMASAAFHEFGHASALRYGGGRARSIGLGIYLIFPAFYSDTTDSYRLGRWGRVRTDLGGFYFHLIFALAIIGLYFAYRREWLLAAVILIDLEIARQLVPLVRFDGYWALGDLVGIPDLLSRLRSVLLRRMRLGRRSGKSAEIKPWAKIVFAAYAIVTAPILLVLLVMLVVRWPLIVSAVWTALMVAEAKFLAAWSSGQLGPAVTQGTQMGFFAIEMAGLAYILYRVLVLPLKRLWRLSGGKPLRRAGTTVAGGVAIGLLTSFWVSSLGLNLDGIPRGVTQFDISQRAHVLTPVSYPQTPPVGGPHSPVWQNCGFYRVAVVNEHAVHSLEHGAVWITYRPNLASPDIAALKVLANSQKYVLVSPYPGLPAPVVASAWGRQMRVSSAADPRLDQFVRAFELGMQAPERGGPCTGGLGTPDR